MLIIWSIRFLIYWFELYRDFIKGYLFLFEASQHSFKIIETWRAYWVGPKIKELLDFKQPIRYLQAESKGIEEL